MKYKPVLIIAILMMSFMVVPTVSAFQWCEWIPFWSCTDDSTNNNLIATDKWLLSYIDGVQEEHFNITIDNLANGKAKVCLIPKTPLAINNDIIQQSRATLRLNGVQTRLVEPSDMEVETAQGKVVKMCVDVDYLTEDYIKFGSESAVVEYSNDVLSVTDVNGTELQDVTLEYNTEQCLVNCKAGGRAVLYNEGVLFEDLDFVDSENNPISLTTNEVYLVTEERYNVTVPTYLENCTDTTLGNGTVTTTCEIVQTCTNQTVFVNGSNTDIEVCTDTVDYYTNVSQTKQIYTPYSFTTLPAGTYNWEIHGKKDALTNIDWSVAFQGFSTDTIREYWAWWNSSWQYRIDITNVSGEYPTLNLTKQTGAKEGWGDTRFVVNDTEELNYTFREFGNGVGTAYADLSSGITSNIEAYYTLDETSGTVVNDETGVNDGTNVGTATVNQPGVINTAYDFDGTNDYLTLTNMLSGASAFSYSAWFKFDTTGSYQRIISKDDNAASYNIMLRKTNTETLQAHINTGATDIVITGDTTMQSGVWYHGVVTYNGSHLNLYLNGMKDAQTSTAASGSLRAATDAIAIGATRDGSFEKWDGTIDEVMISTAALTQEEIRELYNAQWALVTVDTNFNLSTGNEISWFYGNPGVSTTESAFDTYIEATPIFFLDTTSIQDDSEQISVTNNGATFTSDGYISNAYNFDGTNDYVSAISSGGYSHAENWTMVGWVKPDVSTSAGIMFSFGGGSGAFSNAIFTSGTGVVNWQSYTNGVGAATFAVGTSLAAGEWRHLAMVYDGSTKTLRLYENATLVDTQIGASSGTAGDGVILGAYDDFNQPGAADPPFYDGTLDEFQIWGRTLTQNEIQHLVDIRDQTDTVTFSAPTEDVALQITLIEPTNNSLFNTDSINFQCNCVGVGNNCTVINLTIDDVVVESQSGTGSFNLTSTETVSDGSHNWTCYAVNATDYRFNATETFYFEVDTTLPNITISNPLNGTTINETTFDINYSFTDTNIDTCYYNSTEDSTPVILACGSTGFVANYTPSMADSVTYFFYANDTFNNTATNNVTVLKNLIAPTITITEPLTVYTSLEVNQTLNLSTTVTSNGTLDACWYTYPNVWNLGNQITNQLSSTLFDNNQSTFEGLFSQQQFYFNNTNSNLTYGGGNCQDPVTCNDLYNVTVDTSSCAIDDLYTIVAENVAELGCSRQVNLSCGSTLLYTEQYGCSSQPYNHTVDLYPSNLISFTVDDNANYYTCNTNQTFNFETGAQTVYVYANDTLGNVGNQNRSWIILAEIGEVEYNQTTYETTSETFSVNATLNPTIQSVTGSFFYNGTEYAASPTINGNITTLTSTIDIPITDATVNKSFYFYLNITTVNGSTFVETDTYNQTVQNISLYHCTGNTTAQFLNYTTRSASSPYPLLNSIFGSTWFYYLSSGSGTVIKNYTYEDLSQTTSNFSFCFSLPSETITVTNDVEVGATGFTSANSFYTSQEFTNSTTSRSIYLLNESLSFATVLQVYDSNQFPISGVTINVELYDVGTNSYLLVTQEVTSSEGSTVVYLNWLDSTYKFTLIKDNVTLLETLPEKLYESPRIFTIRDRITFNYNKFLGIDYDLTFDQSSKIFTLNFVNSEQKYDEACLRVNKKNIQGDTEICDTCSDALSGTINCDISAYGNGTYIATFYATGSLQSIDWLIEVVGENFTIKLAEAMGTEDSTFYAFLIGILITVVMFINPVMGIIGFIISMYVSYLLGFYVMDYLILVGITIAGGTVAWIISR